MVIVYGLHVRDNEEGNDEVSERETKKAREKVYFFVRDGRERMRGREKRMRERGSKEKSGWIFCVCVQTLIVAHF